MILLLLACVPIPNTLTVDLTSDGGINTDRLGVAANLNPNDGDVCEVWDYATVDNGVTDVSLGQFGVTLQAWFDEDGRYTKVACTPANSDDTIMFGAAQGSDNDVSVQVEEGACSFADAAQCFMVTFTFADAVTE